MLLNEISAYQACCACLVLKSKNDDELKWCMDAKDGNGVQKSEQRREDAETEYHRLLCQESTQQVRGGVLARTHEVEVCFLRL